MDTKLTLSELNLHIKDALTDAFPETVWIVAEISEMKLNRSGHCYLELIEKEQNSNEIIARSRATIWSYTFRMLKPYFETTTGREFSSGIKILVQVAVEYHEAFGLSLNIKDIDPAYTMGDLARQRQEIINKLIENGVFEMNKELPLPVVPQNIAVISSATAAGYQDFIEQLENNEYGFRFYHRLFEAFMQGSDAVPTIIAALERIFEQEDFFDTVVIIRGGGAQADLNCFDNYDLAFNITQFPIPVITGIGHEKDDTITDMVAHTRMKTPTAVAEFLIAGANRFYERLLYLENQIIGLSKEIIERETLKLERLSSGIVNAGQKYLVDNENRLNGFGKDFKIAVNNYTFNKSGGLRNIAHSVENQTMFYFMNRKNELKRHILSARILNDRIISKQQGILKYFNENLKSTLQYFFQKEYDRVHFNERSVKLLDPKTILERGYTLTLQNQRIVTSSKKLKEDDELETKFFDGSVKSKIIKK